VTQIFFTKKDTIIWLIFASRADVSLAVNNTIQCGLVVDKNKHAI